MRKKYIRLTPKGVISVALLRKKVEDTNYHVTEEVVSCLVKHLGSTKAIVAVDGKLVVRTIE